MKIKKLRTGILAIILVFGTMLAGCVIEPAEPTYTVWTDVTTYSQFSSNFGGYTLNDGYYVRAELTSSQWNSISSDLAQIEGKHYWTENQIKNWCVGRGFGNSEANKETAWLLTIDHGFIASRTGQTVYMILK